MLNKEVSYENKLQIRGVNVLPWSHYMPFPDNRHQNTNRVIEWLSSHSSGSMVSLDSSLYDFFGNLVDLPNRHISLNVNVQTPTEDYGKVLEGIADKDDILLLGDFLVGRIRHKVK